jgi:polygalacturonase
MPSGNSTMRLRLFIALQTACLTASGEAPLPRSRGYDIREFGAVPGGFVLNTTSINAAVAAAAAAGGGTVYVPAGRFLTGTVYLKGDITLHLEAGAVLMGSTELKDYPGESGACSGRHAGIPAHLPPLSGKPRIRPAQPDLRGG